MSRVTITSIHFNWLGLHPSQAAFDHDKATKGEKIAQSEFLKDPYGCGLDAEDKTLVSKRLVRNPFHRTVPYAEACPEIANLLHWCGPELFDVSLLPWSSSFSKDSSLNNHGRTLAEAAVSPLLRIINHL